MLVEAQAEIPLAQLWGGGLIDLVDGMRFVAPVRTQAVCRRKTSSASNREARSLRAVTMVKLIA